MRRKPPGPLSMPRVSVVMPCYNAAPYVGEAVASVVAQTFGDWELIVVDDGSTDGSAAVVDALASGEPRLRLLRQPNGGVARARNAGVAEADPHSEYLLFLDADDVLEPAMLGVLAQHLDREPGVGIAYCALSFIDAGGRALRFEHRLFEPRWVPGPLGLPRELPDEQPETPFVSVFCFAPLIPSATLMRRSVYERSQGWDESFGHVCEDTHLYLQTALLAPIHFVPQALVRHRRLSSQSTSDRRVLESQNRRLRRRWLDPHGLSEEQRDVVRAALRFKQRRIVPANAVTYARRELGARHYAQAARCIGGAARIVLASYLRGEPPRRSTAAPR